MAERAVDELLSSAPGASGALCVDSTGLAMACRGDLTSSQSGFVRGLSSKAASLGLGKRGEEPVVAIHTETRYGLRKVPPPTPPFRPASPICTACPASNLLPLPPHSQRDRCEAERPIHYGAGRE